MMLEGFDPLAEPRACVCCGGDLKPRQAKFCSRKCRLRTLAARRAEQRLAGDQTAIADIWPRCGTVELAAVLAKISTARARDAAYRLWLQGEAGKVQHS